MTPAHIETDILMRDLLAAQAQFAQAKAAADVIVHPARERREAAVREALSGGISLRVAAEATGLSHMRIAQIRDGE
jgi:threonine dehydrogenase-like Zn-dependent dehydrogenase